MTAGNWPVAVVPPCPYPGLWFCTTCGGWVKPEPWSVGYSVGTTGNHIHTMTVPAGHCPICLRALTDPNLTSSRDSATQ